jgi:energy-coupling factor transport system permease protein
LQKGAVKKGRNYMSFDPRSKLTAALVATVVLMTFGRWPWLALALGLFLLITLWLNLVRAWLDLLNSLGFAAVSFFVIAWLAFDLATGLEASLRLLAMATVFFLFFKTTPPEDLSNALVKLGIPYAFAFVLSASMQFVQVLARRASNIRDAQRARGIPLDGNLKTFYHLPAVVGPLLIQAFKLADELAEAMEARGFGAPGRRFRREPHFVLADWFFVGISLVVLTGFLWVHFK